MSNNQSGNQNGNGNGNDDDPKKVKLPDKKKKDD